MHFIPEKTQFIFGGLNIVFYLYFLVPWSRYRWYFCNFVYCLGNRIILVQNNGSIYFFEMTSGRDSETLINYLDQNLIVLKEKLNETNFERILSVIWESSAQSLSDTIQMSIEVRRCSFTD
jgi:hypothetical protein